MKNIEFNNTIKPVLSGHSKIDKTKILMTNGSLMKVKSIAVLTSKIWLRNKKKLKQYSNKEYQLTEEERNGSVVD